MLLNHVVNGLKHSFIKVIVFHVYFHLQNFRNECFILAYF